MLSILKKLTLATAAAGMLMLGPISVSDNTAKADGWRNGRGWNNGYYRRGIPGDGWRARYRSYYGPRYYGGYYQPYYGPYYYGPGYSYVPWTSIYNVPGYGVSTPYFGIQVW
jgi:hypothetical protein